MTIRAKGSVIERHGAFYWRRRERGIDLPLERLGSVAELKSKRAATVERDRRLLERNPLATTQGKNITIAALASIYAELRIGVAMKPSGARSVRSRLYKHIVPFFGVINIMRIDALLTQQFIAHLNAQQLSRKTIDAVLATLSCMLDFARQSGFPAPRLDRKLIRLPPAGLGTDERWFTPDESLLIIEAAPQPWRAAFVIAAMLGLRCGEVLGLRWKDINLAKGLIFIRQNAVDRVVQTVKSKNSKADLPMPARLQLELQHFERWTDAQLVAEHSQKLPTTLLFSTDDGLPFTGNEARDALSEVLLTLGIPHGGMHAFRHGTATLLLNEGVPIHHVKAILRHGRIETTQRYSHAQAESLREAVDKGGSVFGGGR